MGCQTACRETNGYGYDEQWLQVVRREPYYVDGKLRMYHLLAPSLDKCALCYANDPEPRCAKCCPAAALKVGPLAEITKAASEACGTPAGAQVLYLP
jgi:Fe-S-cluster-containing dehydrogenase component